MTPCVLADRTVLHIKLVPTDCSMVDSPCPDVASHISLAKWTPVHYAFLCNNPILNRKLVPTDCSMVYLPCPAIASRISLAKWTPVNYAFLFNNAILNRKLVPTDCSMVYLPCRHVTGHMPIASGTNVVILFRTGASFPDSEIVTACAAVIDLACSYSTAYRLLAMRTPDTRIGKSCLWPWLLLPSLAAPPSAVRCRRPVCHVHLQALLWSFPFRSLVCVVLHSALLPSFRGSPVLYSVFVGRWQPRHPQWHVHYRIANFRLVAFHVNMMSPMHSAKLTHCPFQPVARGDPMPRSRCCHVGG